MSLSSILTKHVVSETLIKVVSLLSSASRDMSAEQVKALVLAKIEQDPVQFAENNDIGFCVSRLEMNCLHSNIRTIEELASGYNHVRDDELVSAAIDTMSANIARNISPVLYELREVLPKETHTLATKINSQIPALESAFNQDSDLKVFNWGKLGNPNLFSAAIIVAQDKVNCFKKGVVRQHDSSNILGQLPWNKVEGLPVNAEFRLSLFQLINDALEGGRSPISQHVESAIQLICSDKIYMQTIGSFRDALSGTASLSSNIVSITEKIDGIEDVLRMIDAEMVGKTSVESNVTSKLFSNITTVLTNIALLRASMIFHKIHTLQNKLILADNTVQESTMSTFREAGGTDQMIKNHLLYMVLNTTQKIPNNGLSVDVVLNSSAKAQSVVQRNADNIKQTVAVHKTKSLQDAVLHGLTVHYKQAIESGSYHPKLEQIHESQLNRALASLLKRSVDDIALEYLVTMRNNEFVTGFYKAINEELVGLVKNQDNITPAMISEALCGGIVSVVYGTLVKHFASSTKKAA